MLPSWYILADIFILILKTPAVAVVAEEVGSSSSSSSSSSSVATAGLLLPWEASRAPHCSCHTTTNNNFLLFQHNNFNEYKGLKSVTFIWPKLGNYNFVVLNKKSSLSCLHAPLIQPNPGLQLKWVDTSAISSLFGKITWRSPLQSTPASPRCGRWCSRPTCRQGLDIKEESWDHLQCQKTEQLFGSASWKSWGVALEVRQTTWK